MYLNTAVFTIISFGVVFGAKVYPCITPNNETTTCISLFSCPGLMKALGTLERSKVQLVHKSICPISGSGQLYVCCGSLDLIIPEAQTVPTCVQPPMPRPPELNTKKSTVIAKPTSASVPTAKPTPGNNAPQDKQHAHREMVKNTILPNRRYCGLQHTDDRFYNNTQTALDEFPWLVHVKLTDLEFESEYTDRCSGVLISNRYVLTDAYCAYHATKIVVGEHKTDTNVSCTEDSTGEDCTDPVYEIRVESKVRDGKPANGAYDFALLRLNESVMYSDYIRPLCLPFVESERPTKSEVLVFSGWGSQGPGAAVKKRLLYDQTTDKECYDAELGLDGNIKFANVTLLCVKPKKTNTHVGCNGDHGGALTYSRKSQWFAEAIVIKVYPEDFTCSGNMPASSIKITPKTLDWILDSIQL